ncbi:hypothetical protein [Sphingomonas solaris]|uniref:Uncharacterized protein n=1 Tax=Alterirhizorhabdus solaris TaxID=2529389 RepID=A0A558R309_9SPHN|nr:hypothetical protein [Sphingomonas solaris]TVV73773.1 hypothetical protein FOY91_11395 [Sphingomonas solaris]
MAKRAKQTNLPMVRAERGVVGQQMATVYHVPALTPKVSGPWSCEADKLAWTDAATRLPCIIRRSTHGFLCGYVAVGAGHPLFGFRGDAVPAGIVTVHGGLDYASPCDHRAPEETSICHVPDRHATREGINQWWFGFSCGQVTDLIPGDGAHAGEAQQLGLDQEYRDERYLFEQCTGLAAQLAAAAERQVWTIADHPRENRDREQRR